MLQSGQRSLQRPHQLQLSPLGAVAGAVVMKAADAAAVAVLPQSGRPWTKQCHRCRTGWLLVVVAPGAAIADAAAAADEAVAGVTPARATVPSTGLAVGARPGHCSMLDILARKLLLLEAGRQHPNCSFLSCCTWQHLTAHQLTRLRQVAFVEATS